MKIIPLSRIKTTDSVERRHRSFGDKSNRRLLDICATDYENLAKMRRDRDRAFRYSRGDQWGDIITHKGKSMTEAEYIRSQGNVPLVNNLIRRIINDISGVYIKSQTEPVCSARDRDEQKLSEMMTLTLQCNWQNNKMQDVVSVLIEEFIISGMVFTEEFYEERYNHYDTWTDICDPNKIFFAGGMVDPRHYDVHRIGYMHDTTFNTLCAKFAHSPEDYMKLAEEYPGQSCIYPSQNVEYADEKRMLHKVNFYTAEDPSMCRIYEVWTKEVKARYMCHDWLTGELYKVETDGIKDVEKTNAERKALGKANGLLDDDIPLIEAKYIIDEYWYYQFLTPNGTILEEGESPFAHKSHPFCMKIYPFVNGEAYSVVNSVIDQQRYINRMIVLNDFAIRAGAKGVTMVPEDCVPDSMSPEEFAEEWTRVDGLLFYKAKPGMPAPQQFYNHTASLGTAEMIQLQMQIMEDASSVHSALQGKQPYSGTSAAAYAMQTANSTAALTNVLSRFSSFLEDVATKKVYNIQQFYDEKRNIKIAGRNYSGVGYYDPELCKDILYDVAVHESASTPTHRMMANDNLLTFWEKGAITLEMLLENGDFPFADQLLQSLNAYKEELSKQQQDSGEQQEQDVNGPQFSPELRKMVRSASDQRRVADAATMLRGDYRSTQG